MSETAALVKCECGCGLWVDATERFCKVGAELNHEMELKRLCGDDRSRRFGVGTGAYTRIVAESGVAPSASPAGMERRSTLMAKLPRCQGGIGYDPLAGTEEEYTDEALLEFNPKEILAAWIGSGVSILLLCAMVWGLGEGAAWLIVRAAHVVQHVLAGLQ